MAEQEDKKLKLNEGPAFGINYHGDAANYDLHSGLPISDATEIVHSDEGTDVYLDKLREKEANMSDEDKQANRQLKKEQGLIYEDITPNYDYENNPPVSHSKEVTSHGKVLDVVRVIPMYDTQKIFETLQKYTNSPIDIIPFTDIGENADDPKTYKKLLAAIPNAFRNSDWNAFSEQIAKASNSEYIKANLNTYFTKDGSKIQFAPLTQYGNNAANIMMNPNFIADVEDAKNDNIDEYNEILENIDELKNSNVESDEMIKRYNDTYTSLLNEAQKDLLAQGRVKYKDMSVLNNELRNGVKIPFSTPNLGLRIKIALSGIKNETHKKYSISQKIKRLQDNLQFFGMNKLLQREANVQNEVNLKETGIGREIESTKNDFLKALDNLEDAKEHGELYRDQDELTNTLASCADRFLTAIKQAPNYFNNNGKNTIAGYDAAATRIAQLRNNANRTDRYANLKDVCNWCLDKINIIENSARKSTNRQTRTGKAKDLFEQIKEIEQRISSVSDPEQIQAYKDVLPKIRTLVDANTVTDNNGVSKWNKNSTPTIIYKSEVSPTSGKTIEHPYIFEDATTNSTGMINKPVQGGMTALNDLLAASKDEDASVSRQDRQFWYNYGGRNKDIAKEYEANGQDTLNPDLISYPSEADKQEAKNLNIKWDRRPQERIDEEIDEQSNKESSGQENTSNTPVEQPIDRKKLKVAAKHKQNVEADKEAGKKEQSLTEEQKSEKKRQVKEQKKENLKGYAKDVDNQRKGTKVRGGKKNEKNEESK